MQVQNFNRNADELETWISAKLKVASDDAHKDLTNLQVRKELGEVGGEATAQTVAPPCNVMRQKVLVFRQRTSYKT